MPSGEVFVMESGAFERPLPKASPRMRILSPFDNSVIQRERIKALFQFDYQLECYVPEEKRQYGYFCLPLLFKDELIGRMDCKAHRKTRVLEVKSLYFEQKGLDEEAVIPAFVDAITAFSQFQNCDSVTLTNVYPKYLSARLKQALAS